MRSNCPGLQFAEHVAVSAMEFCTRRHPFKFAWQACAGRAWSALIICRKLERCILLEATLVEMDLATP